MLTVPGETVASPTPTSPSLLQPISMTMAAEQTSPGQLQGGGRDKLEGPSACTLRLRSLMEKDNSLANTGLEMYTAQIKAADMVSDIYWQYHTLVR